MAYRGLKLLHLLGLALFLGSIFGHIVSSVLGGEVGGSASFVMAREHIAFATRFLTMPGLYLAIVSGVLMVIVGRVRERWLLLHGGLAAAILLLALLIIEPAVSQVLAGAHALAHGSGNMAGVADGKRVEDGVGGANVILTLVTMGVGIWGSASRRR